MKKKQIKIRKAKKSDINDMVSLLKILFSIENDFKFNPDFHYKGLELLLKSKNAAAFVAESPQKKVVAMATAQIVISSAEGAPSVWIEDVVVSPEWRRKGIASALLAKIAKWTESQGARRMQLLADISNTPALTFYKSENWHRTNLICLRKHL